MLLLLTACGNGEPEFVPLTVEFLDGYFGLVDAGNEIAECDPQASCEEEITSEFVMVDATGGTVVATIDRNVGIMDMVYSYGSPYNIISGGEGDDIDVASVDNDDYEWVAGVEIVQPELCSTDYPTCSHLVVE